MVTTIEAPFTFLQKPIKVLWLDAVKAAQISLCLVPEIFYPINMISLLGKAL